MPLSDEQRNRLEAEAARRGIDPARLIAAADKAMQTQTSAGKTEPPSSEAPPNLYMYHLPFVTVNEVREVWLKLPPVAGGDQYAGEWAAKQGAPAKSDDGAA